MQYIIKYIAGNHLNFQQMCCPNVFDAFLILFYYFVFDVG